MLTISRRTFLAGTAGLLAASQVRSVNAQAGPIRIGVGADPAYASFFVAVHEGIFEAEGANAELQLYTDGGEALNALVAQQVDLAAAGEPTTMVRLVRAPLRPLAIVYESTSYIKMVLGAGIANPQEIQKFGMVPGSISEYCVRRAVEKFDLDANAIEFVSSGPPELPALLSRGDIDAFFAWEPWPSLAVAHGAKVVATNSEVGYDNTQWLTASEAILNAKPDQLKAILRALAKACEIVRADPERAADAVNAVTKIPKENSLSVFPDMAPVVRDFTEADLESFDRIAQFLYDSKVTDQLVSYRSDLQMGFFQP